MFDAEMVYIHPGKICFPAAYLQDLYGQDVLRIVKFISRVHVGTALTPSLESRCITSRERRKEVSKEGFKYLVFYVVNCIK